VSQNPANLLVDALMTLDDATKDLQFIDPNTGQII
jgi:hypothetical protein